MQRNLAALAARGVRFVEPGEGFLACGWIGKGRLAEPDDVVTRGRPAAARRRAAAGPAHSRQRRARPSRISIPVRFVGNRSSGRMGYAIAAEAAARGADVVLVSGPDGAAARRAVREVVRVRRAAEMHEAVLARAGGADAIIMAAAVANYTPARRRRAEDRARRRDADAGVDADARHPGRPGGVARRSGAARVRSWSALPPRPTTSSSAPAPSACARASISIVANDVSRSDAGFEVGHERRDPHRRRPRRDRSPSPARRRWPAPSSIGSRALLAAVPIPCPDPRSMPTDPRDLAEHLRYYADLGVYRLLTRPRLACPPERRRGTPAAPAAIAETAAASVAAAPAPAALLRHARRQRRRRMVTPSCPLARGRAGDRARGPRASARAASCTRGARTWCSASATPRRG